MSACCPTQPNDKTMEMESDGVERTRSTYCYRPNVDIVERGDEIVLMADMPGVQAKDVDIDFDKGILTVHGRIRPRGQDGRKMLRQEYGLGDFFRSFQVGQAVDSASIKARLEDGVLIVTLSKSEALRTRKIAVQSSN